MREYGRSAAGRANRKGNSERADAPHGDNKRAADAAHRHISAVQQPGAGNRFAASPRIVAQRSTIDAIVQSPRVAQQRERLTYPARPLQHASMGGAVLQAQWAYVDNEAGKHLNLTKTSDPTIFVDSKTGVKYKTTGMVAKNGHLIVRELSSGGQHSDYRYHNFTPYQNWTSSTSGVTVDTEFGQVGAFHNRGAPKITSKQSDYGNVALGDKYSDYVTALRSGGKSDADIAQALLDMDDTALASNLEKRAAAMLHVTVYLAEEWRKQGAAKIYRAVLRAIAEGKATFDNFLDYFKFIASADQGRKQVGRFKDIEDGNASPSDLNDDEQIIYEQLSPYSGADYDSDDDLRKEKALKKGRDYSEGSGNKKAWHNYT